MSSIVMSDPMDLRSSSPLPSDSVPPSDGAQLSTINAPIICSRKGCKRAISSTEGFKLCLGCREYGRQASRRAAERKAAEIKKASAAVSDPPLSPSREVDAQEKRPADELDSVSAGPPAKRKKTEKSEVRML